MNVKIIEQEIAESYVENGKDVEAVKAYLIKYGNQVNFNGAIHKVYGSRLLAIMHSLKAQPTTSDIPEL